MSNNANQLTNEQALQLLFEVTELDHLTLNAKHRRAVNQALQVLDKLVVAAAANKAESENVKVVDLTPVPETSTV